MCVYSANFCYVIQNLALESALTIPAKCHKALENLLKNFSN